MRPNRRSVSLSCPGDSSSGSSGTARIRYCLDARNNPSAMPSPARKRQAQNTTSASSMHQEGLRPTLFEHEEAARGKQVQRRRCQPHAAATRARDQHAGRGHGDELRITKVATEDRARDREQKAERRVGEAELQAAPDGHPWSVVVGSGGARVDIGKRERVRVVAAQEGGDPVPLEDHHVDQRIWRVPNHPRAQHQMKRE